MKDNYESFHKNTVCALIYFTFAYLFYFPFLAEIAVSHFKPYADLD